MTALRMQFFMQALLIFAGIWLTGIGEVHWFAWFPVMMLTFAGITGTCPGLLLWKKLGFK